MCCHGSYIIVDNYPFPGVMLFGALALGVWFVYVREKDDLIEQSYLREDSEVEIETFNQ